MGVDSVEVIVAVVIVTVVEVDVTGVASTIEVWAVVPVKAVTIEVGFVAIQEQAAEINSLPKTCNSRY